MWSNLLQNCVQKRPTTVNSVKRDLVMWSNLLQNRPSLQVHHQRQIKGSFDWFPFALPKGEGKLFFSVSEEYHLESVQTFQMIISFEIFSVLHLWLDGHNHDTCASRHAKTNILKHSDKIVKKKMMNRSIYMIRSSSWPLIHTLKAAFTPKMVCILARSLSFALWPRYFLHMSWHILIPKHILLHISKELQHAFLLAQVSWLCPSSHRCNTENFPNAIIIWKVLGGTRELSKPKQIAGKIEAPSMPAWG